MTGTIPLFPLQEAVLPTCEIVLLIYDSTRVHDSLQMIKYVYKELSTSRIVRYKRAFPFFPILIGTKCDVKVSK